MAGLAHDLTHHIVNVQWRGGLPVEFDNGGHVIWQGEPINMSKGTISMWFRVPKETLDNYARVPDVGELSVLQNMIPILAFSGQSYGPWTEMTFPVINTFYQATSPSPPHNYQPFPYTGAIPGPTWQLPYWPCVIGIYIGSDGVARLAAVLQTTDVGVPKNTNYGVVAADGEVGTGGDTAGLLFGPTQLTWTNASEADARMEWFQSSGGGPEVKPDEWHHVLLSWDLQAGNSAHGNAYDPNVGDPGTPYHEFFDSRSILYCAFDDNNLTTINLPTGIWTDGFGDNEIVCVGCYNLAGGTYFTVQQSDLSTPYYGFPSYTVTFAQGIQMDEVAIPSAPMYESWTGDVTSPTTEPVEALQKIEVAELQIFSDLLLDTNDESKRRAFIAADEEEPGAMVPVDPKEAEEVLGRRPDILLHLGRDWQTGKNTGEIGLERIPGEENMIIEAGQFRPTGTIRRWRPDPILHDSSGSSDSNGGNGGNGA